MLDYLHYLLSIYTIYSVSALSTQYLHDIYTVSTQYLPSIYTVPRFGLVPCLRALHDIGPGEEIFVWYGYDLDYCPQWYMDAWDQGNPHIAAELCNFVTLDTAGNFAIPDSMKKEYGEK